MNIVLIPEASIHIAKDPESDRNDKENDAEWSKEITKKGKTMEKKAQRKGKIWSLNGANDLHQIKSNHLIWTLRLSNLN